MKVKLLDLEEIRDIYETCMKEDFPPNELKPFSMMAEMYKKGTYEALGIMDGEERAGYAFFIRMGEDYLFDYLAIRKDLRNKGIGSDFLDAIKEYYKDADSIIGEVEDFTLAAGPERDLQERRYHFYLRNGLADTGVRVWMFDVDYIVLMIPARKKLDKEAVRELYQAHYRAMLPDQLYRTKVRVK